MIVLTGSGSFIGAELQAQLVAKGLDYLGLDALPSSDPRCLQADICSPDIADRIPEGADALIHLAAISRDKDCAADLGRAFTVNVNGTINLIQAAKARKVRQLLFASSEWVYGEVENDGVQTEDTAIDIRRIQSEYAITKLVGEQMLRLACAAGGLSGTVLRFGIVYGPRPANWSAVENLFFAARDKPVIEVGAARTARRFIHVADICRGIVAALGRNGHEIFNLSGNDLVTLRQVVEASVVVWGTRPTLQEKNPDAVSIRNPDNAKARRLLGWEPQLDLASGLFTLQGTA